MRATIAVLLLLGSLGGCVGSGATGLVSSAPSPVTGDQRGGKIPNGMADVPAAMQAATDYCTGFGKKAQITRMDAPSAGGLIAFECR